MAKIEEKVKEVEREETTEDKKSDKDFIVSEKVLSATLNYLATRTYAEVAGLIQALSQSKILN